MYVVQSVWVLLVSCCARLLYMVTTLDLPACLWSSDNSTDHALITPSPAVKLGMSEVQRALSLAGPRLGVDAASSGRWRRPSSAPRSNQTSSTRARNWKTRPSRSPDHVMHSFERSMSMFPANGPMHALQCAFAPCNNSYAAGNNSDGLDPVESSKRNHSGHEILHCCRIIRPAQSTGHDRITLKL